MFAFSLFIKVLNKYLLNTYDVLDIFLSAQRITMKKMKPLKLWELTFQIGMLRINTNAINK